MKFIQYIPLNERIHCAKMGVVPVEFEFTSLREFNNHEFIRKLWNNDIFKRFTVCRDKEVELVAELKNGNTYKVGTLDGNIYEIPEWLSKEELAAKEVQAEKDEARQKQADDAKMGKLYSV